MYVQCSSSTSAYSHADLDWVYGVVWARLYSCHCQLLGVIRVQHGELAERLQHNWWNCKCSFFPFFLSLSPIHITLISHKPFSLFSLSLSLVHSVVERWSTLSMIESSYHSRRSASPATLWWEQLVYCELTAHTLPCYKVNDFTLWCTSFATVASNLERAIKGAYCRSVSGKLSLLSWIVHSQVLS